MRPGDLVGQRFEIEAQAGAGGMGRVFRARDRLSGERVALKVLHKGLAAHSARLLREARILAQLHHPGIVRYIAHGEDPAVFVAIEWLEGEDLARRLSREPLSMGESVELTRRVAEALAAAHARGVIHRDVKPSNLFLCGGAIDKVKVLDFGIARARAARVDTRVNTETGQVLGTVGYMAPEQASAGRELDARADIFSLGCVLFECLTGRSAFEGDAPMEVLAKILLDRFPRVRDVQLGVPASLDELVRRMMAKEPDERPPLGVIIAELEALGSLRGRRSGLGAAPPPIARGSRALSHDEAVHLYAIIGQEALTDLGQATLPTIADDHARDLDAALVEQVSSRGGRLEQRPSGVRIAVFREDGPAAEVAAQAVRCALAARDRWPSHVLAVVAGPSHDGRLPSSGVFARASAALTAGGAAPTAVGHRRPDAPEPGRPAAKVVVDETVAALVEGRFEVRRGPGGFEVVGERRGRARAPRPFVGRRPELRLLEELLDESIEESIAGAALVLGGPGAGKSALCAELLRRVEARDPAPRVWEAAAAPAAAEPLALLADLVAAAGGAEARAPGGDAGGDADHAAAWERALAAACDAGPIVVVIDDLQWADLATVRVLDHSLHRFGDRPWMLVGLARPAGRGASPAPWSARRVREVRLVPLTRRASEELVAAELGPAAAPGQVARVAARGAGEPSWLIPLARAAAEGRPGTPPSVIAAARARFAELEPETRRVLRAASVFGETFWPGGVAALLGPGAERGQGEQAIATLIERGVVAPAPGAPLAGEAPHAFVHGVVRDAAYASLTEPDRTLGHKLAADWLEAAGERDAMVLAGHFERGGEPRRAVVWYLWATEQAFERNELETVVARAERGIDCDASGAVLGELRLLQAEALGWIGGASRQGELAAAAMALLDRGSAAWCRAAVQRALAGARRGDRAEVAAAVAALTAVDLGAAVGAGAWLAVIRALVELHATGEPALAAALADRLDAAAPAEPDVDPAVLVASRAWMRAIRALYAGDPAAYLRDGATIEDALVAGGHRRHATVAAAQRALAHAAAGAHADAVAAAERAIALADEQGLEELADRARAKLGRALALAGDAAGGEAAARRALDDAVARGDRAGEGQARAALAFVLAHAGDLDGAARAAEEVADGEAFPPAARGDAHATLAEVRLRRGDARGALAASERAIELLAAGPPAGDRRARELRAAARAALA